MFQKMLRSFVFLGLLVALIFPISAMADGTETLAPPSIPIATGTGFVAAGTGLSLAQPAIINISVPGDVRQVLLYWEGHMSYFDPGDDTITVNGIEVQGTLIGGPAFFFYDSPDAYSSAYRADITSLGLVNPGANSLSIGGLSFDRINNGAGLLVLYDDGSVPVDIQLRDGLDLAFALFDEPRRSTIPQTFTFAPSPSERTANLSMFFSSVEDFNPIFGTYRPTSIEVTTGGVTTVYSNLLGSFDGQEWDTLNLPITIPAGAESLTVQAFSRDDGNSGFLPASLTWIGAALSIPPPPGPELSSICGFVYVDADNDGVFDAGEMPISGVEVNLNGTDDLGNPVSATAMTGADGGYCFSDLRPGVYTITETQPAGYLDGKDTQGTPGTGVTGNDVFTGIILPAGYHGENNNFGELLPASICGFVYVDADNDGVFDAGEMPISGVEVNLNGTDDLGNPVSATAMTGADGGYCFSDLRPGTYTITETQPAGYLDGKDTQGTPGTGVTGNDVFTGIILPVGYHGENNNFGELLPPMLGSLGDFVWLDLDADGVYDPGDGEMPIPGVRVELYDCSGGFLAFDVTDANGYYLFDELMAGCYKVVVPASNFDMGGALYNYAQTYDYDGLLDNMTTYNLGSGEHFLDADFGYRPYMAPGVGTPGYWANHPEAWPVDQITIGGLTYTKEEAIAAMLSPVARDKTYTMFPALVAAKLNVAAGNVYACVADTIMAADAWMASYPLGSGVKANSPAWIEGEPLYWILDDYNNGLLCAPARD